MSALSKLSLYHFRNYASLDLALDERHVCLYGPNGAGKTNILEAVSQLGAGRGLRSASIQELKQINSQNSWTISARIGSDWQIGIQLDETTPSSPKRIIRMNGAPSKGTKIAEIVRIIWLTPSMDTIFRGGASERCRFYDRQVFAFYPDHGKVVTKYEKSMRERNAVLEKPNPSQEWLKSIETRMAEFGAQIAINRVSILKKLQANIDNRAESAFPKATLNLNGLAETFASKSATQREIADSLAETWQSNRNQDSYAGRTLLGPHRTDLQVYHRPSGTEAKFVSTGQQKALLTSLILATSSTLKNEVNSPRPIVLLDEAAAHLDPDRRAALFDELETLGGQSWLTGTDSYLFESFGNRAQHFEVNDGNVTRQ